MIDSKRYRFKGVLYREMALYAPIVMLLIFLVTFALFYGLYEYMGSFEIEQFNNGVLFTLVLVVIIVDSFLLYYVCMRLFTAVFDVALREDSICIQTDKRRWDFPSDVIRSLTVKGHYTLFDLEIKGKRKKFSAKFDLGFDYMFSKTNEEKDKETEVVIRLHDDLEAFFRDKSFVHSRSNGVIGANTVYNINFKQV